jgi:hypothetical protein
MLQFSTENAVSKMWNVDTLVSNDRGISNYTTAVAK